MTPGRPYSQTPMQGRLALRLTELSNKESWLSAKSLQLLAMARVDHYENGRCSNVRTWLASTRLKGGAGLNRVASISPDSTVVPEHIGPSLSFPAYDETIANRRLSQQAN